jgi:hypothetical protein
MLLAGGETKPRRRAVARPAPPALDLFASWSGLRDLMGLAVLAAIGAVVHGSAVLALFGPQWLARLRCRRAGATTTTHKPLPALPPE